jgi:hypothetical protein
MTCRPHNMSVDILDGMTIPPAHWLQALMGPAPISLATLIVTLHQGRWRIGHENQWHPNPVQRIGKRSL